MLGCEDVEQTQEMEALTVCLEGLMIWNFSQKV